MTMERLAAPFHVSLELAGSIYARLKTGLSMQMNKSNGMLLLYELNVVLPSYYHQRKVGPE